MARVSRLEWICVAAALVVFGGLVVAEPDIASTPLQSTRAIAAVVGGALVAGVAFAIMLRFQVPPMARVLVLGVPLVAVSWWTISPFFIDDVVHDDFETSIAEARSGIAATTTTSERGGPAPPTSSNRSRLLGSGTIVGLAGHRGTGDAGIFRRANGSIVVRLENFDIENGPDLQLYLVPGADRRDVNDSSHHFGALRGNVGDQTYEVPASFPVASGSWTVLVWCRAFTIEFVAATVQVAA